MMIATSTQAGRIPSHSRDSSMASGTLNGDHRDDLQMNLRNAEGDKGFFSPIRTTLALRRKLFSFALAIPP